MQADLIKFAYGAILAERKMRREIEAKVFKLTGKEVTIILYDHYDEPRITIEEKQHKCSPVYYIDTDKLLQTYDGCTEENDSEVLRIVEEELFNEKKIKNNNKLEEEFHSPVVWVGLGVIGIAVFTIGALIGGMIW